MNILSEKSNYLMIEKKYSNLKDSKIVVMSVPYEATVSYGKGTRRGPKAILEASHFVEFYDEEFNRELCFECGIAALQPTDLKNLKNEKAILKICKDIKKLIEMEKFVIVLGGEHTISIAPIKAHSEKYKDLSILHFDAHSDLRESYLNNPYSHASTFARICDFFQPNKIIQVGIRAQCIEESKFIKDRGINTFYAWEIRKGKYGVNWQREVVKKLSDIVYISFDVDYFDPSIMPSTGTPEPDGFDWSETIEIFRELRRQGKKIIGFDVVELAPIRGLIHPDMVTAKLVYKMMNFAF
jgi:agmatinase